MKNNIYKLEHNKFGAFFIKNNKYYYLDQFETWGLDTTLWYDTIDYLFYRVNFILKNNDFYIKIRKTKAPIKNL